MIHTVKGFGVINKAEVDAFLELSCFFYDPADVVNLNFGSSAFSKPSLYIWKFLVMYCWSLAWRIWSITFSSVTQSCPTLCDPMNHSTPGLPVHHQLPEFTQTYIHRVSDAIQPSYPLSPPSPPAPNPSQHQSLFQWVNSSHEVAKLLEFQL